MKMTVFLGLVMTVVILLPLVELTSVTAEGQATYVSASKCKMCHNSKAEGEVWNAWKATAHARALEALSSEQSLALAKEKGLTTPPSEAPECLRCHVTAFDPATGKPAPGLDVKDGVQCEACHGPASLHIEDGKRKKKGEEVDMSKNQTHPEVSDCVVCHNDQSPTWNPELYTLKDGTKSGFDFEQAWEKIKHGPPAAS